MHSPTHQHQELDIFTTYLDINEIEHDQIRIELAHRLLHQDHSQIITFCKYGFVWYYFDQFIKGEISLEQFMTMGDVEGSCEDQINPHVYQEEHPCYLDSITPEEVATWNDQTLVIVDTTLWAYYTKNHPDQLGKGQMIVM